MITTRHLTRIYGGGRHEVRAVNDVSVEVAAGEFVAVVGPSGSGKSSFLSLIGCLDAASSGEYELAGQSISGKSDDELSRIRNRRIGFVFQDLNLVPRTSAVENVELPLLYRGVPGRDSRSRALARLAQVGLRDRAAHLPSELSGGEKQRVAIARALVNDPVVILADEPTGSLDRRTGFAIMALLRELNRGGMTTVVVTHDAEIAAFASRILGFTDGRLVSDERLAA
jgi:putative ABC transport system ATP-binding protein